MFWVMIYVLVSIAGFGCMLGADQAEKDVGEEQIGAGRLGWISIFWLPVLLAMPFMAITLWIIRRNPEHIAKRLLKKEDT